jgi:hypothetical protein
MFFNNLRTIYRHSSEVEQRLDKALVGGSIPPVGTILKRIASHCPDQGSVGWKIVDNRPIQLLNHLDSAVCFNMVIGGVAQLGEQ